MEDTERQMELEALSAIFVEGEELQVISENEVVIICDPRCEEGPSKRSVKLRFIFPDGYPAEEPLQYDVIEDSGLNYETKYRITQLINEVIERNQGAPMAYPIVEAVNEALLQVVPASGDDSTSKPDEDGDLAKDKFNLDVGLQLKQLCLEQDRVTDEQFQEWSKRFRLEMIKKGVWRDIDAARKNNQMTGKQIFETKSAPLDTDENENVFWSNEALYEEDDICDDALD
ncbi:hypothetical protein BgAZ_303150 [Babesia gibsoni]|uniref:RWD domain-containing protein n=1 Tax=Babesia gibsoni TaxID=33632 RepID=A0AAD8LR13_BABGI|nr:hypothetical protein BgAZ_303150 [Babesia gibsoni]